jgi:hypothetical protein
VRTDATPWQPWDCRSPPISADGTSSEPRTTVSERTNPLLSVVAHPRAVLTERNCATEGSLPDQPAELMRFARSSSTRRREPATGRDSGGATAARLPMLLADYNRPTDSKSSTLRTLTERPTGQAFVGGGRTVGRRIGNQSGPGPNASAAVVDNRVLETAAQAGRCRNTPICAS